MLAPVEGPTIQGGLGDRPHPRDALSLNRVQNRKAGKSQVTPMHGEAGYAIPYRREHLLLDKVGDRAGDIPSPAFEGTLLHVPGRERRWKRVKQSVQGSPGGREGAGAGFWCGSCLNPPL